MGSIRFNFVYKIKTDTCMHAIFPINRYMFLGITSIKFIILKFNVILQMDLKRML